MNLPGIVGLHAALSFIEDTGLQKIHGKKMALTRHFLEGVRELPAVRIAGRQDLSNRVAVVSLDFLTMDNAQAAFELELNYGIMTRVGLHCAPLAHKSLGTFPRGTVRFSFSAFNTEKEVDICIDAIKDLLSIDSINI